ncbi:MAG: hypothetical protein QME51_06275 [Planctomycetota bacterium]|nr:hypothetical protein [Planctomycetota bacterium]
MENHNNPTGISGDEENTSSSIQDEEILTDTADETDGTGGKGQDDASTTGEDEEKEESFLTVAEKEAIESDLKLHPEWRPFIEQKQKQLQAGFTRAMQKVPKELRNPQILTELQRKAELLDKLQGDPEAMRLLNNYILAGKKDKEAKKEGVPSDFKELFLEKCNPEQKEFVEWFLPFLNEAIKESVKPLQENASLSEERTERQRLTEVLKDKIRVDDDETWITITEYKKENPNLSYEQCAILLLAEQYPEDIGHKETEKVSSTNKTPAIGSTGGTGSSTGRYTQEQIDAMTPEQYATAFGLSRKPE